MARRNRQMCVKIAKDVLAQLRLKRFRATPGTYVKINSKEVDKLCMGDDVTKLDAVMESSFKEFFKRDKQVTCQVCALGAAFVSMVNIENECSVEEVMNEEQMWPRLEKYFGRANIDLMETAFECSSYQNADSDISCELLEAASDWGSRYDNNTERMQAIMRNVIRNNGDFKLPKKILDKVRRKEKAAISL